VLGVFSNTANSASLLASQLYSPYGASRYGSGTVSPYTNKGFTGQYNDPTTGLDYYGARYYDPVVGLFVSADTVWGDIEGMNPYSYVGNNPQTYIDPNGEMYAPPPDAQPQSFAPIGSSPTVVSTLQQGAQNWQLSTCAQMAQAGHPCNVQGTAQGPGQMVEYQRPSPLSIGCLGLLSPCVQITTPSLESSGPVQGWSYPTFPVNFCVPFCTKGDDVGEGEEGASNGKESDLTKLIDDLMGNLLFAADGGGEGESLGLGGGNLGDAGSLPPSEGQLPETGGEAPHSPGDYWRQSSLNNAPTHTTPGTQTLTGVHVNNLGQPEPWIAYYDQYGRMIARTDYALGDLTQGIEPTHYHVYSYPPFSVDDPEGKAPFGDHFPGEYNPNEWPSGWEYIL